MLQPTELFCHAIIFFVCKFNMLTSFSSNFLAYIEGAYIPHMIFQRSKGIVSPPEKYGGTSF